MLVPPRKLLLSSRHTFAPSRAAARAALAPDEPEPTTTTSNSDASIGALIMASRPVVFPASPRTSRRISEAMLTAGRATGNRVVQGAQECMPLRSGDRSCPLLRPLCCSFLGSGSGRRALCALGPPTFAGSIRHPAGLQRGIIEDAHEMRKRILIAEIACPDHASGKHQSILLRQGACPGKPRSLRGVLHSAFSG